MTNLKFPGYIQISKVAAKKLFFAGIPFAICPHNYRPGGNWCMDYIPRGDSIAEWKEKAKHYAPDGITPSESLWCGSVDETAWQLFYTNWAAYNLAKKSDYARYYRLV